MRHENFEGGVKLCTAQNFEQTLKIVSFASTFIFIKVLFFMSINILTMTFDG